jgi:hypothetical protein
LPRSDVALIVVGVIAAKKRSTCHANGSASMEPGGMRLSRSLFALALAVAAALLGPPPASAQR